MYHKRKIRSTLFIIAVAIFALALGLLVRQWLNTERPAEAAGFAQPEVNSPHEAPPPAESASSSGLEAVATEEQNRVAGLTGNQNVQIQRVNDIEVRVTNFRKEGGSVKVDVCFDMPDNADWTLWHTPDTTLKYSNGEVSRFGFEMLSLKQPSAAGEKGQRCDVMYFDVPPEADLSEVTLSIAAIGAEPREGEECAPEYVAALQELLEARGTGIRIGCVQQAWGAGLTVLDKPTIMSQEEAELVVYGLSEELITIRGPWVFTFAPEE